MHTNLRLLICRSGFVLFALLPTLVVGGWIIRRGMPEYTLAQRTEWERELSQRLGLSVSVGDLQYPHPGVARLIAVELANPETREVVATIRELDVNQDGDSFSLHASQPVVNVRELSLLGSTLHERLLQSASGRAPDCQLVAADLTVHDNVRAVTFPELIAVIGQSPAGDPTIDLEYVVAASSGEGARGRLSALRNRQIRPPSTRWKLDTGGASLPCWLASSTLPPVQQLGGDAQFAGTATWMLAEDGLQGEVTGRLTDVDLDSLISEQFIHQLSGRAVVTLQPAIIHAGQLSQLRGSVQSMDGWVSPSMLAAAGQHLGLQLRPELSFENGQPVPFRQLSIGFLLTDRTLQLSGNCDATRPGVALANAAGPIAEVPAQHTTASVSLLRTLLPETEWQVPATRQTGPLAAILPVPDLSPELTARHSGHTPTRLAPPGDSTQSSPLRQPR